MIPHVGLGLFGKESETGIYIHSLLPLLPGLTFPQQRLVQVYNFCASIRSTHPAFVGRRPLILYMFDVTLCHSLESNNVSATTFLRLLPPKQFTSLSEAHRNSKQIFDQAKRLFTKLRLTSQFLPLMLTEHSPQIS